MWSRVRGSIPAWAGETLLSCSAADTMRVYPRVGGGNALRLTRLMPYAGLSPRGRGKPRLASAQNAKDRSIPAWAGETHDRLHEALLAKVYPRVGGGNLTPAQERRFG